jgi:hypothetical protein
MRGHRPPRQSLTTPSRLAASRPADADTFLSQTAAAAKYPPPYDASLSGAERLCHRPAGGHTAMTTVTNQEPSRAATRPESRCRFGSAAARSGSRRSMAAGATLQKRRGVVQVVVGTRIHSVASAPPELCSSSIKRRCIRTGEHAEVHSGRPAALPSARSKTRIGVAFVLVLN